MANIGLRLAMGQDDVRATAFPQFGKMGLSQYEKLVHGATKPKHSPPKAKYIDPIVATTFANDGSFKEVVRALGNRLQDSNSSVVFKALIVVHSLVRVGSQEAVLGYLSSSKALDLVRVTSGYDTAQNLNRYAVYLDRRIRTYGALKYDIIRDKSERRGERDGISGCNRLRSLSVDKGLLREVTLLQKEMDTLSDCKFYLDDMEDDLTMTALRLMVKDLLMIFQAVNEGVINVLEHYFEMAHSDASTALKIYKRFCSQTEKIVAYLGVAKKLQNIIHVPVPNLKHAPVSLASSLEEYLSDPNFEKNRQEYQENKAVADGLQPPKKSASNPAPAAASTSASTPAPAATAPTPEAPTAAAPNSKAFIDFFDSIEKEQTNMFNPQTGSPTLNYFQQQASYNPFMGQQQMMPQMTGYPGMVAPQFTGFAPFGGMQQPPSMFPPQPTGPFGNPGMMMPQPTGFNPFRQSISGPAFSPNPNAVASPFMPNHQVQVDPSMMGPQPTGFAPMMNHQPAPNPFGASTSSAPPVQQFGGAQSDARVASPAPLATAPPPLSTSPAPLKAQPTGSRNPFAPPPGSEPAVPKIQQRRPTMNELFMQTAQQQQQQQVPPQQTPGQSLFDQFVAKRDADAKVAAAGPGIAAGRTGMSDLASSFALPNSGSNALGHSTNGFSSTTPFQPSTSPAPSSATPLQPQSTGFGGSLVKPFKPTSSFGASLAESLPPMGTPGASTNGLPASSGTGANPFGIAQPGALSASTAGISSQPTGYTFSSSGFSSAPFGSQQTGNTSLAGSSAAFGKPTFAAQTNGRQESLI